MALTHILAAIRRDGAEECVRIEAQAAAEAERLLAAAEVRGAARERQIAQAIDEEIAALERHEEIVVKREAAMARRELRGRLLCSILNALEQRLHNLRDDGASFGSLTARLLDQALSLLPDADTIHIDPRDEDLVRRLLEERGLAALELRASLTTWGGVCLERAGVHRAVNTLEARREAAAEALIRIAVTANPTLQMEGP